MYERGSDEGSNYSYGSGTTFPGVPAQESGAQVWYRSPSGDRPAGPVDVTPGPYSYDPIAEPTASDPTPAETPDWYPMRNSAGRWALISGVFALAFTTALFPLFPLGIMLGITAIVLGRRGRFRARYGFASNGGSASAGVALGAAAVLLASCFTALTAWLATSYDVGATRDCVSDSSSGPAVMRCLADVVEQR